MLLKFTILAVALGLTMACAPLHFELSVSNEDDSGISSILDQEQFRKNYEYQEFLRRSGYDQ